VNVVFSPSANEDPGGDLSYDRWSFGDGTSATGNRGSVSHTYPRSGTYTVDHEIADVSGSSASTSQTITVVAARQQPPGG
jgi:PKD repeat protein